MDLFGFTKEVDIRPYLIQGSDYWKIVNDRYFEKRGPDAFRQDFWTFENEAVFAAAEAEMFAKRVRLDGKANYLGVGLGDCTFYQNLIKFIDPKTYEKTTFWLVDKSESLRRNAEGKLKEEIVKGKVKILKGDANEIPKEIPDRSISFMRGDMVLERLEKDFVYKSGGTIYRTQYLPVVQDKIIPNQRFVEMAEDGLDPHGVQFFRVMVRPGKLFNAYLYSYGMRDNELAEGIEYVVDVGSTKALEEVYRVLAEDGMAMFHDFFAGLNGMRCSRFSTVQGGGSYHFLSEVDSIAVRQHAKEVGFKRTEISPVYDFFSEIKFRVIDYYWLDYAARKLIEEVKGGKKRLEMEQWLREMNAKRKGRYVIFTGAEAEKVLEWAGTGKLSTEGQVIVKELKSYIKNPTYLRDYMALYGDYEVYHPSQVKEMALIRSSTFRTLVLGK